MDWTLIKIRFLQLKREIKLLGLLYNILILIVLALSVYQVFKLNDNYYLSLYTFASNIGILFLAQITRRDRNFIFLHLKNPQKSIFTEYVILSFILSGFLLFSRYWYFFLLIILFSYAISFAKYSFRKKTKLGFLGKIISPKNFEWLSGIRKYKYSFGILYALSLSVSPFVFLPLLVLWILTVQIISFYEECEPLHFLFADNCNPARFLKKKIINHSFLLLCLYFPVLVINSIFNPNLIIFNFVFFIVQLTVLALTVFFKYKIYFPREIIPGNTIYLVVIQVCTVLPFVIGSIPFLLPLPLFLCFKYYFSAKQNLKLFLYD